MVEDLTKLIWNSMKSTTNGVVYKSYKDGIYYKLPIFEYKQSGIYFNDRLNISELISSDIGSLLRFNVVNNKLRKAKIKFKDQIFICNILYSYEYNKYNKDILPFEKFCRIQNDFNKQIKYISNKNELYDMLIFDFLIRNLDRHGRNIEININTRNIQNLFDHGLSMFSTLEYDELINYRDNFNNPKFVNNYIGYNNLLENLSNIKFYSKNINENNIDILKNNYKKYLDSSIIDKIFEFLNKRLDFLFDKKILKNNLDWI